MPVCIIHRYIWVIHLVCIMQKIKIFDHRLSLPHPLITYKEVSACVQVTYIGTGMCTCLSNYMYMHLVPLDLFT